MIINEKKRTLKLLKTKLDNVTGDMYQDLKDSIIQGLRAYRLARKEWERVFHVIKEYGEVKKYINASLTITENNGNSSQDKFIDTITNEIDLAQNRLKVNNTLILLLLYRFSIF